MLLRRYHDKAEAVDFDSLTVKQLKEHADKHGVDLGEATKKADIIAALEAASTEPEPEAPADEEPNA
jgi:hypothetical protein